MGQLLATLNLRSHADTVPEIGFDIESKVIYKEKQRTKIINGRWSIEATPLSEELGDYNQLFTLLVQPNTTLLKSLKEYKPASESIRCAIATPNAETEETAWNAVLPTVDMLTAFYSYSSELGKID